MSILDKQTITDLLGHVDFVSERCAPGSWVHEVDETARTMTVRDSARHVIAVVNFGLASPLFANLQPDVLRELIRGYQLYKSSMIAPARSVTPYNRSIPCTFSSRSTLTAPSV